MFPMSWEIRFLCLETYVSYVLNQDTAVGTVGPPRESWRLYPLRGWSHAKESLFTGGA